MQIGCIFASTLYAIQYEDEDSNELERLFELWQDIEYLEAFFEENLPDLESGFFGEVSIDDAVRETRSEAKWLEKQFIRINKLSDQERQTEFNNLFQPLDNKSSGLTELVKSKAYGNRQRSWLRLYAIKVSDNLYVITGGTIKLTATMEEREHTKKELRKLERCRSYLKEEGLCDEEGFVEL